MAIITLTTDFGLDDWFVAAVKGVILSLAPRTTVVDLTHNVPPGDLRAGAFALAAAAPWFPDHAIHLAVVDPGVGGPRAALAIRTRHGTFLGPDNGLLSRAALQAGVVEARHLTNPRLLPHPVSQTFHGRDVFAPMAAHLARGLGFRQLGPSTTNWITLEATPPRTLPGGGSGTIVHIDHFGNAITNLPNTWITPPARVRLAVARRTFPLHLFYGAVPPGQPLAIAGSTGCLEIAVRDGSAARTFGLRVGQRVRLTRLSASG